MLTDEEYAFESVGVPEALEADVPTPSAKKRGRPSKDIPRGADANPKSAPKRKRATVASRIAGLARQLIGAHQMVAMLPGLEVFRIADWEAELLASAMVCVADEYGVVVSGKIAATAQLIVACVVIYGPRVAALRIARMAVEKSIDTTLDNVVDLQPN
ncbi:MAG: hypothetical protein ACREVA_03535 [Burkholderiales bacterium]